jgi:glycosyltransferase involved in cell wall biosynthesis
MNLDSKKQNNKISVIVCAYNQGKWLSKCLKTLINQKKIFKKDYEIILVNDASKDSTDKIIKNFEHIKYIKYINNKINLGLPSSINKAIEKSKAKYIVRVDADDFVDLNFLQLARDFLNNTEKYQAVAVDYFKVNEKNLIIRKHNCKKQEIACGIMFVKKSLYEIGLYNEKFKMREGHELKKRFLKKFKIGRIPLALYNYRQHQNNRTKNLKELELYDSLIKKIKKN